MLLTAFYHLVLVQVTLPLRKNNCRKGQVQDNRIILFKDKTVACHKAMQYGCIAFSSIMKSGSFYAEIFQDIIFSIDFGRFKSFSHGAT